MLTRPIDQLIGRLIGVDPWTQVYGVARTLLACSTLLTLLFTKPEVLFTPALDIEHVPVCFGATRYISLFCLLDGHLRLACWIAIAILGVVASGWRPRVTGVFHWWICFSLVSSAVLVDGGDHVAMVLSFLLLPITLTDSRRSHFDVIDQRPAAGSREECRRLIAHFSRIAIRVQIAVLYLHAAFAKAAVTEWQNGTALYYWLTDPQYGVPRWQEPLVLPLLRMPYVIAPATWAVMAFEFLLFTGLLARREYLPYLLATALTFHCGIALMHGLVSFSLAMAGALVLFLRPFDQPFAFRLPWAKRARQENPPLPLTAS